MTKLAIVGSRDYPAGPIPVIRLVATLKESTVVVSGGARGVDSWAALEARARGLAVEEILADWQGLGKKAGMIRNTEIVERADYVVAFWDGKSRGTKNTIEKARKAGKLFAVYGPDGEKL